jgi:Uma2 family endonuclease
MAAPIQELVTVEELELMPDDGNRYEVIEGELFVSRAPDYAHQTIITNLILLIGDYLKGKPIGTVTPGPGVIFSKHSGVIPDLVFLLKQTKRRILSGGKLIGAPELAIEIISPGVENRRRDRVAKRNLYGRYGVQEYWIVDPKARTVEVYNLKQNSLTLTKKFSATDTLTSTVLPGFSCRAEEVFADLD